MKQAHSFGKGLLIFFAGASRVHLLRESHNLCRMQSVKHAFRPSRVRHRVFCGLLENWARLLTLARRDDFFSVFYCSFGNRRRGLCGRNIFRIWVKWSRWLCVQSHVCNRVCLGKAAVAQAQTYVAICAVSSLFIFSLSFPYCMSMTANFAESREVLFYGVSLCSFALWPYSFKYLLFQKSTHFCLGRIFFYHFAVECRSFKFLLSSAFCGAESVARNARWKLLYAALSINVPLSEHTLHLVLPLFSPPEVQLVILLLSWERPLLQPLHVSLCDLLSAFFHSPSYFSDLEVVSIFLCFLFVGV